MHAAKQEVTTRHPAFLACFFLHFNATYVACVATFHTQLNKSIQPQLNSPYNLQQIP